MSMNSQATGITGGSIFNAEVEGLAGTDAIAVAEAHGWLEFRIFGGIEDFLTTRITREHKDGHVFLVFVVCVCFVVERGFSRKEARENAKI